MDKLEEYTQLKELKSRETGYQQYNSVSAKKHKVIKREIKLHEN